MEGWFMKLLARLFSMTTLSVVLILICATAIVGKFVIDRRIALLRQAAPAQAAPAQASIAQPAPQQAAAIPPTAAPQPAAAGQTRHYYIAADEVEWNYAPSGMNKITGQPFDDTANVFVQRGDARIGHVYRKALYREYTDASFTKLKP